MSLDNQITKEKISQSELKKVSRFAYWKKSDMPEQKYDCDSCSSFCSGGSCTTCTGVMDGGHLQRKKYKIDN